MSTGLTRNATRLHDAPVWCVRLAQQTPPRIDGFSGSLSRLLRGCLLPIIWASLSIFNQARSQDVLTQHNDNTRSGTYVYEHSLNPSNVLPSRFGKLFERHVDGAIYAQPLYVQGVRTASRGIRNIVLVATMRNTVYAFDADDPSAFAPIWRRTLDR